MNAAKLLALLLILITGMLIKQMQTQLIYASSTSRKMKYDNLLIQQLQQIKENGDQICHRPDHA
jgi:hypothetical protein